MAWIGAAIQGVASIIGSNQKAKAAKQALEAQREARDYAINKSGLGDYAATGKTANAQQAALLGIGGDPREADAAFDNYLNSTGYKFQLKQGQDALTSSAAAKGLLNSGATAKALTKYGQGIGSSYFNTYNNQLGQIASRGEQASSDLAHTVTGTANSSSNIITANGQQQGDTIEGIGNNVGQLIAYQNAYGNGVKSGSDSSPGSGSSSDNIFGGRMSGGPSNPTDSDIANYMSAEGN